MGSEVVKAIKDSSVKVNDEPTFVKIKGINFRNGIIEVKVLSRLLKNAPILQEVLLVLLFVSMIALQSMNVSISALSMQE